jgi:DNA-binding SARP family transcriptional activator
MLYEVGHDEPVGRIVKNVWERRLATGAPVTLPTRKAQALLAYLAVRPGQAHPRDKLAALLWADHSEAQARDSFRHTLVGLRKALRDDLISTGGSVALRPAAVDVDVVRFEEHVAARTPESLAKAVEVYRGDLLEGFMLREAALEEWLVGERERLRELALDALHRLLVHLHAARAIEPAIRTAQRLLVLDATQEVAHRTLMSLYMQQGRRATALRQYQTCIGILQRELGTEPEAETRKLYQKILRRRDEGVLARPRNARSAAVPARSRPAMRPNPAVLETPLIGRSAEIAALHEASDEARWGRGATITILGEAGVGKTQLVAELAAQVAIEGAAVLVGRAYASTQSLPFGPWVDAIRTGDVLRDLTTLDSLGPVWTQELRRLFPELEGPEVTPSEDPGGAMRLFEAMAQLVGHMAAQRPLLLVLEDVHWADEMSLKLLAFVARRVHQAGALIVATVREEELADNAVLHDVLAELERVPGVRTLNLRGLSHEDTVALVHAVARGPGDTARLQGLAEQIWTVSEGNALTVIEVARASLAGDVIRPAAELALPQRVRDIITRRFDRLSPRSRELINVIAVIGRAFDFALLWRAAHASERETAEAVEELVRRRILHEVGGGFDFVHDRFREVARDRLLAPQRMLLHRSVADAIETVYADALERHYASLAGHYRMGEVWDKAVVYLYRAGLQAAMRAAYADAVACFESGLAALRLLPEDREWLEYAVDIRAALRASLVPKGDVGRTFDYLREAEALAERLGDIGRQGWLAAPLTNMYAIVADWDRSRVFGERALAIARSLDDRALGAVAEMYLVHACHCRGEYAAAIARLESVVPFLDGDLRDKRLGIGACQQE